MVWQAPERLWLTADREHVVKDGDPAARYLLTGGEGDEIPRDEAIRLGLVPRPSADHFAPPRVTIERGDDTDRPRAAGVHATIPNRAAVHGPQDRTDGPHLHEHDLDPANGDAAGAAGVRREPGAFHDHVTFDRPQHSGQVGEIEPVGEGSVLAEAQPSSDAPLAPTLAEAKGEPAPDDDDQADGILGYRPATGDHATRGPQESPDLEDSHTLTVESDSAMTVTGAEEKERQPPVQDKAVRGPLQPRRGPGTKGPQ
jgi:hypothetical protein